MVIGGKSAARLPFAIYAALRGSWLADSGFAVDVLVVGAGVRAAGARVAPGTAAAKNLDRVCVSCSSAFGISPESSRFDYVAADLGVQDACQILRSHITDLFGIAKRSVKRVASTGKTVPLRYTRSSNQERKWTG